MGGSGYNILLRGYELHVCEVTTGEGHLQAASVAGKDYHTTAMSKGWPLRMELVCLMRK